MPLRLPDKWLWDFWFARDGSDYHIFYLQANRSLKDEQLRHWNVSIGHAVSQNLTQWEILPDALSPSPYTVGDSDEPFDSYTTWTGSIIRHNQQWRMLYTGSMRSEKGLVQRIGLASSDDLMRWQKYEQNPVIVSDPRWYELLDVDLWHDQAWRDPYIYFEADAGVFHAFITARVKDGEPDARGVIGHAVSNDLIQWEVKPPITEPGEFGHMEVPQLLNIQGRYYMLFSVAGVHHSSARRARLNGAQVTGTHYLVADSPEGPYKYLTDQFMVGDEIGSYYSGKLVQAPDGSWRFMAFRNLTADGQFIGEITNPFPVAIESDGRLIVDINYS
jgi:beta-fructofuranosidase